MGLHQSFSQSLLIKASLFGVKYVPLRFSWCCRSRGVCCWHISNDWCFLFFFIYFFWLLLLMLSVISKKKILQKIWRKKLFCWQAEVFKCCELREHRDKLQNKLVGKESQRSLYGWSLHVYIVNLFTHSSPHSAMMCLRVIELKCSLS